jgi:hypothetical protein
MFMRDELLSGMKISRGRGVAGTMWAFLGRENLGKAFRLLGEEVFLSFLRKL